MRVATDAWGEMTYRYVAALKEGAREMARMLPEALRMGGFGANPSPEWLMGGRYGNIPLLS